LRHGLKIKAAANNCDKRSITIWNCEACEFGDTQTATGFGREQQGHGHSANDGEDIMNRNADSKEKLFRKRTYFHP
jgi:hypothetical protein